ncbi:MAG: hypothetical protein JSR64_10290 [Nitrospira sp.]|nr:hypothetical protein [Nitrospira sp.]MBX3336280.1 hypothetical protein [Nitrospira sp.]MCW5780707.1 hypothetical protein [Nitrospira sp.]HNK13765.1 hypothetical protein [Nitrospira sp.]HNL87799.1 hypothetical protein [Nitrospira sp.]
MGRLARILVGLGLLVAAAAALWVLVGERPVEQPGAAFSSGSQRVGRNALSHGGPVDDPISGRRSTSRRDGTPDPYSNITTR